MPRGFPWGGGCSWRGLLHEAILIEADNSDECPSGLPDFFQGVGVHVVSARLGGLLQTLGAEVELWPASLAYAGKVRGDFFVANSLNQMPAVDLARSHVELDEVGIALNASDVTLDEGRLGNAQWVKVRELQQVAVTGALQERLKDSGFTGFRFVDPSTVRL
jgi:hypothetical protein